MAARTPEPRDPRWRKVRKTHLKTWPNCAWCGTRVLVEVHHVIPFHIDRRIELEPTNLITLCRWRRHHLKVGHLGDWTRFNENVREDCEAHNQQD